jgi:hypothetical protein
VVVLVLCEDDRKVSVTVKNDEVDIDSESKDEGAKDKFRIVITDKSDGLKADVESQSEDKDQEFKDKRKFTLFFDRIIQYDTGGAYDGSGPTVGTPYSLGSAQWNDFSCPQQGSKYVCSATTRDGVFTATFEFSGEPFASSGLDLSPEEMKISVDVNNFPYANNNNLRLALFVYGWAKVDYIDKQQSGDKKEVNTGGSAFSWVDTATVDGTTVTVANSPVQFSDDGTSKKFAVWFSFLVDRPNRVNWDPVLAINASSLLLTNFLCLFLATIITVLA